MLVAFPYMILYAWRKKAQNEAQAQASQAAQAAGAAQGARSTSARPAEISPVSVDPREELHRLLLAGRCCEELMPFRV